MGLSTGSEQTAWVQTTALPFTVDLRQAVHALRFLVKWDNPSTHQLGCGEA